MSKFRETASILAQKVSLATAASGNEATLRHNLETLLAESAKELGLPWVPFQLDLTLFSQAAQGGIRFADVAHGAVIIEYEPPSSFGGRDGSQLKHAREQAAEYGTLLHAEEGRSLDGYALVCWDGSHISYGRFIDDRPHWEPIRPFDSRAALRLLRLLASDGTPLVHPRLLSTLVGPESVYGAALIPQLFQAIRIASHSKGSKTFLLFTEWKRLFGQTIGIQSEKLKNLLRQQGLAHEEPYDREPASYLFALNTYIALVAKLVAALSLPDHSQDLTDPTVSIDQRIDALESGRLFEAAGITNMLAGDFFSWYRDDLAWPTLTPLIEDLLSALSSVSFDVTRKSADSIRDLFKGMYQSFVPQALRHAMGEYYTPDWLAAHALDAIHWTPDKPLLDPTCGSGTFLLEAIKRRVASSRRKPLAHRILEGIFGIDLNPLAVLAARASIVVSLAPFFDTEKPLNIPVFLADAINPATAEGNIYRHSLQTELGVQHFGIPKSLVESQRFFHIFYRMRELLDANYKAPNIYLTLTSEYPGLNKLSTTETQELRLSIETLVFLHNKGWNGIWCSILAERFAAGNIPPVSHIAGNPPWVKWSHLPPDYAEFIKERCLELGVFSQDRWVGGIESDISTVITYEVIDKWLARNGQLAFFITGTVFANESSQGFRRFELKNRSLVFRVTRVEDFDEISPFEGVSNHATLLCIERDRPTTYPVPYVVWSRKTGTSKKNFASVEEFGRSSKKSDLLAQPVAGTDAGPWLKGTKTELKNWEQIIAAGESNYFARKGITPDRNGIFFVEVLKLSSDKILSMVRNDPTIGRTQGIPRITGEVETKHLFPILRGRGIKAFSAVPDPKYRVLLPQRDMHGDPDLPTNAPRIYRFLRHFREELEHRSSYRRFQKNQPYWSIWSTGPYTFSPFKVVWREMVGTRFVAAYIGKYHDPILGRCIVIPDHKVYFVPVKNEQEAAYLTAVLNAPTVSQAISSYAAQLSLGVSVVEYLKLPAYDRLNSTHALLSELAQAITSRGGEHTLRELQELDALALKLFSVTVD